MKITNETHWQKILAQAFSEYNWELLKSLPKNAVYQRWIPLKAVSFLENSTHEQVSNFIKFIDKNNFNLNIVLVNDKKISLAEYLLDQDNYKALFALMKAQNLENPSIILSYIQSKINKVSLSKEQKYLIDCLDYLYQKNLIKEDHWKSVLPYLMVFSLCYGENIVLDNVIRENLAKVTPKDEIIFSKPPILANSGYIYTLLTAKLLENRTLRTDADVINRFIDHISTLSKVSSFHQEAIQADGKKIGNSFDNINKIKKCIPPQLTALFEKIFLTNFITVKEPSNQNKSSAKKVLL